MVRWGRGRTLDRSFTCRVSICKADAGLGIQGALEKYCGVLSKSEEMRFCSALREPGLETGVVDVACRRSRCEDWTDELSGE